MSMQNARIMRWTAVGFAIALVLGGILARNVGFLSPSEEIRSALQLNSFRIMAGGYVLTIAAALLVIFSGVMGAERLSGEARPVFLNVGTGAGLVSAALIFVTAMAAAGAAERAASQVGIGLDSASALVVLSGILFGKGVPVSASVMIGAIGMGLLEAGKKPRWFGWLSAALSLGMLSPVNFYFVTLLPVWFVLAGWLLPKSVAGS